MGTRSSRLAGGTVYVLVALILVALNLRIAVTTAAALLVPLQEMGALTPAAAVLVPSIPTAIFAVAGIGTPRLAARLGIERTIRWGMLALTTGLALRVIADPVAIVAGTVIATGGLAIVNILLPAVVRSRFPGRIGPVTTAYSMSMSLGSAAGAAVAVPVADWLGSPNLGLAVWALPAAVGLVVWTFVSPTAPAAPTQPAAAAGNDPDQQALSPHAPAAPKPAGPKPPLPAGTWLLAAYFAMQSLVSYVVMGYVPAIAIDAGIPAARAGLLLGIAMAVGIPGTIVVVSFVRSAAWLRFGFVLVAVASGSGILGFLLAPTFAPELWAALLGLGMCVFPLVLALIAGMGASARETSRVSGLAQSVGYTVATLGPLGAGAMRQVSGSWTEVLIGVTVLIAVQCTVGLLLTRVLARTKYA
ncbi:MFS transporter [Leucobacter salsicius]|uniref:MFS transporter n=1 Tax=Leucobacter salsicius TaxID=664638 RepID=UPI000348106B|nr:MFS transporter [Leucobacter salsicius]